MKISDISNGPEWILWVVGGLFALLSIVLLSGHGSGLIAGFNTMSKEEKKKYNKKKLCRVTGAGMAIITVMIVVMGVFEDVLPSSFAYVTLGIVGVDIVVTMILSNTICKK